MGGSQKRPVVAKAGWRMQSAAASHGTLLDNLRPEAPNKNNPEPGCQKPRDLKPSSPEDPGRYKLLEASLVLPLVGSMPQQIPSLIACTPCLRASFLWFRGSCLGDIEKPCWVARDFKVSGFGFHGLACLWIAFA